MDVTVAVVPRERFRPFLDSLKSLFKTISDDVPVIVVEGGAPQKIVTALRDLKKERPFELITSDRFLLPNEARNRALEKVETKYVAFCDNDLEYTPYWLEAMYENAEEHGAGAVAPTTLIGPHDPPRIHHAGGGFRRFHDKEGRERLQSTHALMNTPLFDAEADQYAGAAHDPKNFEYHCVLLNTQAVKDIGGHDERLINYEHLETSLRLLSNGHKITYAPKSHVMYRGYDAFTDEDWPYFHYRWAMHREVESARIHAKNWGFYHDPRALYNCFVLKHIQRATDASDPPVHKWLMKIPRIRSLVKRRTRRRVRTLNGRLPDPVSPRVLSKPEVGGLDRAGIAWTD